MRQLVDMLKRGDCTLAMRCADGSVHTYNERGVKTLYTLLTTHPELLQGAIVADRVVGRGAAALMIAGGVAQLHALVASESAIALLETSSVVFTSSQCVPAIINRAGTGPCPVEALTADAPTIADAISRIATFLSQ